MNQMHRYNERMELLIWLLGGKCVVCGTQERLEFDHIDPNSKSFEITKEWGTSEIRLIAEAMKCQLLCKSCHTDKTSVERGFDRSKHGTPFRYRRGCRCYLCKEAWATYKRDYRNRA